MKFRRRKYIVSSRFQWKFVIVFVTVALMGSVAATVFFNLLALERLEELRWSAFVTVQSTSEVLRPFFISANLFSLIFVSVLLVITGAWMLRKVNGPIYRIMQDLKTIGEGNFSSAIILRQKDEFKDVAVALNEMLDGTRERFGEFRARHEEISQALVELEIDHAKGNPVDARADKIIAMIQDLQRKISTAGLEEVS
jgi:methyl-accepting chemotaxis protein